MGHTRRWGPGQPSQPGVIPVQLDIGVHPASSFLGPESLFKEASGTLRKVANAREFSLWKIIRDTCTNPKSKTPVNHMQS